MKNIWLSLGEKVNKLPEIDLKVESCWIGPTKFTQFVRKYTGRKKHPILRAIALCIPFIRNRVDRITGKWTVTTDTELRALHGLDAEEELIALLSEEINKEIGR